MTTNAFGTKRTLRDLPTFRLFVIAVVAVAIGAAAYGLTASNTVPDSTVGAGTGSATGYAVTNIHYSLSTSTPINVDSLSFTVAPTIPSTGAGTVITQIALTSGGPTTYACTSNAAGDTVTCPTTTPQLQASHVTAVTVVAAQ